MIILRIVLFYIGLSQEGPATKVEPTCYTTVLDRKLYTNYCANFIVIVLIFFS